MFILASRGDRGPAVPSPPAPFSLPDPQSSSLPFRKTSRLIVLCAENSCLPSLFMGGRAHLHPQAVQGVVDRADATTQVVGDLGRRPHLLVQLGTPAVPVPVDGLARAPFPPRHAVLAQDLVDQWHADVENLGDGRAVVTVSVSLYDPLVTRLLLGPTGLAPLRTALLQLLVPFLLARTRPLLGRDVPGGAVTAVVLGRTATPHELADAGLGQA